MQHIALILSGGNISHRMTSELSHVKCPALLPLHLSTIGGLNVQFFNNHTDVVYLAIDQEHSEDVRNGLGVAQESCELLRIVNSNGVVDTLEQSLTELERIHGSDLIIYVNLVTTIPTALLTENQVGVAQISNRLKHLCSRLEKNDKGWVTKAKSEKVEEGEVSAFTGSFTAALPRILKACGESTERKDLVSVVASLLGKEGNGLTVIQQEWIDCGHEISYFKARSQFLTSRSFNRLRIDTQKGVIQKRSTEFQKMEDEASYYDLLPDQLKIYFPRLMKRLTTAEGDTCGYELEYYSYPTLAEYALYWKISEDSWWQAFEQLNQIVTQFRSYPASFSKGAFHSALVEKTTQRLESFYNSLPTEQRSTLWKKELHINGQRCESVEMLLPKLFNELSGLYSEDAFSIVHGDLCYNNILYSPAGGLIKLIDPRGSYGDKYKGVLGDYRYDLAKLMHSVQGGYDAIVNGFFHLHESGTSFDLEVHTNDKSEVTQAAFAWLLKQQGFDDTSCKIIMASLFLSMIPLHADNPLRQKAFFINGLDILNKLKL